jgi:broad specificity phosphatase PhoE
VTLYLVRHGLAAAGVDDLDPGLDEIGHTQARSVAGALLDTAAERLVVSPLRRTRETADPIGEALDLDQEIRVEVAEVFDPNMPTDERKAMIGSFMEGNWSDQPEALLKWREQVLDALVEFGAGTASDTIVVSHYIAISVAIGEALGDDRVVPMPVANCSITAIRLSDTDGSLQLADGASYAHLPKGLVTGIAQAFPGRAV